jgi:hypothetical protein
MLTPGAEARRHFRPFSGTSKEVAEKLVAGHKGRPLGLKPALILEALR